MGVAYEQASVAFWEGIARTPPSAPTLDSSKPG